MKDIAAEVDALLTRQAVKEIGKGG